MVVLRIVHILSGVFWAGAAFMMAGYVEPTVRELGPEGGKFMQGLIKRNFSTALAIAGFLTAASGISMYWILSNGFRSRWVTTGTGISLLIGGLAGILALISGLTYQGMASNRMRALMKQIQSSGNPPNSDQSVEIQALRERLRKGGIISVVLFTITLLGMAAAQYANF